MTKSTESNSKNTVDAKKERDLRFASVTHEHILMFQDLIGEENVLVTEFDIQGFTVDVTRKYMGDGSIVLTPTTTE